MYSGPFAICTRCASSVCDVDRLGTFPPGTFSEATFEQETLQLDSGDTLVMFSDGIPEALNPVEDEFGDERLLTCVRANQDLTPPILLEYLLETVRQFAAGAAQSDDRTLLVLRYLGP